MDRKDIGHPTHPRSIPIPSVEIDDGPEQPFAEGAHDIDPDLRYRLISEAAYALYAKRGYVDGFDVDDWLDAETEVDHVLLRRGGEDRPSEEEQG